MFFIIIFNYLKKAISIQLATYRQAQVNTMVVDFYFTVKPLLLKAQVWMHCMH